LNKKYLLIALFSSNIYAAPTYDDWNKVTVNVTQAVQHFGGNYTCKYNQYRYGHDIYTGIYGYHIQERQHSRYIADSITARPILIVQDLAEYLNSQGFPVNDPYHIYQCNGIADLPKTYIEQKVIGTRIEYVPIQPFPQYVQYEYAGCNTDMSRGGNLYISGTTGTSNMQIKDVTDSFSVSLYSGPTSGWVGLNMTSFGVRTLSIKLDSGSSYYLTTMVPQCTGGGGDLNPL
jgi:hypothetical protein